MRILITGSRTWDNRELIAIALEEIVETHPGQRFTLISGGAKGADEIAEELFSDWGWEVERHPANWSLYGKRAGMIRNAEMVDSHPDVCLAFIRNQSPGATACAQIARRAGIPVTRYELTDNYDPEDR